MKNFVNNYIQPYLPLELEFLPPRTRLKENLFISVSPRRSGQHAVLHWLCSQMKEIIHFNNCHCVQKNLKKRILPITGRVIHYKNNKTNDTEANGVESMIKYLDEIVLPPNFLYSLEDYDIENKILLGTVSKIYDPKFLFILRDPYNWLASTIAHVNLKELNKNYLEQKIEGYKKIASHILSDDTFHGKPFIFINYNSWCQDAIYRQNICKRLEINLINDSVKNQVMNFGGGSSFDKTSYDGKATNMKTMERWEKYKNNETFINLIQDKEIEEIGLQLFNFRFPLQ